MLNKTQCPFLIRYYSAWWEDMRLYIQLELAEGGHVCNFFQTALSEDYEKEAFKNMAPSSNLVIRSNSFGMSNTNISQNPNISQNNHPNSNVPQNINSQNIQTVMAGLGRQLRRSMSIQTPHGSQVDTSQSQYQSQRFQTAKKPFFGGTEKNRTKKKRRKMSEMKCYQLLYEMSSALAHLHSKGIVHLDVKPQNILCARMGETRKNRFRSMYTLAFPNMKPEECK